jgi:hypothetical protein
MLALATRSDLILVGYKCIIVKRKQFGVVARIASRLTFSLLGVVMGCGLVLWVCYNEFTHRLSQYSGAHWWEPLGAGPVMVGIGIYWLRSSRSPRESAGPTGS